MPRATDSSLLAAFFTTLANRDPNTQRAYQRVIDDFLTWLTTRTGQTGGEPFHLEWLTETTIQDYLTALLVSGKAPRTRAQAISVLRRLGQWAVDEGLLRRNPARRPSRIHRASVTSVTSGTSSAPPVLANDQRAIVKSLVEQMDSPQMTALFALGYWVGLRVSEIVALRLDQCVITPHIGVITLLNAPSALSALNALNADKANDRTPKDETATAPARTIVIPPPARLALWNYLHPAHLASSLPALRDPESAYVFTGQRAALLRRQGRVDHLSERGLEHLWARLKAQATAEEWEQIKTIRFQDLRHDWFARARASGWSQEETAVYAGQPSLHPKYPKHPKHPKYPKQVAQVAQVAQALQLPSPQQGAPDAPHGMNAQKGVAWAGISITDHAQESISSPVPDVLPDFLDLQDLQDLPHRVEKESEL